MFKWISNLVTGKPASETQVDEWLRKHQLEAAYDGAAIDNPDLNEYWSLTDTRSPLASNSRQVRERVRSRSRYEHESSPIFKRLTAAKVGDVIGPRGPSIEFALGEDDAAKEKSKALKRRFNQWAKKVNFSQKIKTMARAYYTDGETFAELMSDETLTNGPQISFRVTEADLYTDPTHDQNDLDGIVYDENTGKPVTYRRLRQHPGDTLQMNTLDFDDIPAEFVIHWFKENRPGQRRGISEYVQALPLQAELRRYRKAVLGSSEKAASFAAVMKSNVPASSKMKPAELSKDIKKWNIFHNMFTRLPFGWDISQLKAEQPTANFADFCDAIYQEIGGCTRSPLNVVTGTSRGYNYSSGKLDYNIYWSANEEDQFDCECFVLNRIAEAWLIEALLYAQQNPGWLPEDPLNGFDVETVPYTWKFAPRKPIDDRVEAQVEQTRFNVGLLTDEDWALRHNRSPEEFKEAQRRMIEGRKDTGMPLPPGSLESEMIDDENEENDVDESPTETTAGTPRNRINGYVNGHSRN